MNKKQIILVAAASLGLFLVLRGLKKIKPENTEEFNSLTDLEKANAMTNALRNKTSTSVNYIGDDGQGLFFNYHGNMSLDNLVRGYKKP